MGQAKRKGTFEERKALAIARDDQNAVELHARWKALQQARAEKLLAMTPERRDAVLQAKSKRMSRLAQIAGVSAMLVSGTGGPP